MMRAWILIFFLAALSPFRAPAIQAQEPGESVSHPQEPDDEEEGPGREQGKDRAREGGPLSGKFLEKLADRLKLSSDQQKKLREIAGKARPEIERMEAELRELGKKLKKAMRQAQENIREALDLEQREVYDEMVQRFKRRERRGPHPFAPGEGERRLQWRRGVEGAEGREGRGPRREMRRPGPPQEPEGLFERGGIPERLEE